MQTPKNVNQTDDSEEKNRGEKDELALSPQVRSIWLGMRDSNPDRGTRIRCLTAWPIPKN
jgi:hypothetical protein